MSKLPSMGATGSEFDGKSTQSQGSLSSLQTMHNADFSCICKNCMKKGHNNCTQCYKKNCTCCSLIS